MGGAFRFVKQLDNFLLEIPVKLLEDSAGNKNGNENCNKERSLPPTSGFDISFKVIKLQSCG